MFRFLVILSTFLVCGWQWLSLTSPPTSRLLDFIGWYVCCVWCYYTVEFNSIMLNVETLSIQFYSIAIKYSLRCIICIWYMYTNQVNMLDRVIRLMFDDITFATDILFIIMIFMTWTYGTTTLHKDCLLLFKCRSQRIILLWSCKQWKHSF